MYCVIYRFKIHQNKEELFIKSWAEVTEAFKTHCNALGSRLHKYTDTEYIAYAQWPSKKVRDKAELPQQVINTCYAEMKSCCESIEVLYEITPVSDLLINDKNIKS